MLIVLLPDKILDVQLPALSGMGRSDALVDFNPELAQLLKRVESSLQAHLSLIGVGQVRNFGNGLFEGFDHIIKIYHAYRYARGILWSFPTVEVA